MHTRVEVNAWFITRQINESCSCTCSNFETFSTNTSYKIFFPVVLHPKSGLGRVVFEVPKSHNKHDRTAIPSAGFEPVVSAVKRLKTLRPPAATS